MYQYIDLSEGDIDLYSMFYELEYAKHVEFDYRTHANWVMLF